MTSSSRSLTSIVYSVQGIGHVFRDGTSSRTPVRDGDGSYLPRRFALNLQLRCTFGTRVVDMINHFPTFPLVLDYGPRLLKTWTPEDGDGLLFALHHLSRASEIMLSAPQSTLAEMTAAMAAEAAPRLEHLTLHSQSAEFVLPKSFLDGDAPHLRHLILTGASLATLHPLLPSGDVSRVSRPRTRSQLGIFLARQPGCAHTPYVSPQNSIHRLPLRSSLAPGFGAERFLPLGQIARVDLPALTQLIYRGVSAYMEALLARIRAPLIQDIDIALFNQLTVRIPRICAFIRDIETFQPTRARIDFTETSAHIVVSAPGPPQSSESPDVSLSVSCPRLDFQLSAMAQICIGLFGTASGAVDGPLHQVEELMLGFYQGELPDEWRDEVDTMLWRALLAPFRPVRTLRVHVALAPDLGRAVLLPPPPAPAPELLLPGLRTVVLLHRDGDGDGGAAEALKAFVDERNRAGYPVSVEPQDLSRLSWLSRPAILSSSSSSSLHKRKKGHAQ